MKLKRKLKFWWQRRIRGYDDSDIWNLDKTLSEYILPRLKAFVPTSGYPGILKHTHGDMAEQVWESYLSDMIYAFECNLQEWNYDVNSSFDYDRINRGFELFGRYYQFLWN